MTPQQYELTRQCAERFYKAHQEFDRKHIHTRLHPALLKGMKDSLWAQYEDLKEEMREYENACAAQKAAV